MEQSGGRNPIGGSILVVDADPADRRFVELGMGKTGRYQVESASSAEAALELLRGHVVDLMLTEVELGDSDAFQLMKRIRARPGGKELPVIFLTKNKRGSVLAAALQAGAVDFIAKPFQLTELLARCDAVIGRQRERRMDAVTRSYSLAGDLGTVAFADLIHLLEIGNRDGQLFFTTEHGAGEIKLQKGRVFDASFGSVQGENAFYALMREERGRFEFQPGTIPPRAVRTITLPTTSLLMEGARQLDMHRRDSAEPVRAAAAAPGRPGAAVGEVCLLPTPDDEELPLLPRPVAPTPDLVVDLRTILADPFSLGAIRFCNRAQLIELLTGPDAAQRCLGILVAPTLAGVSLFAGMAAPLGEVDIASALEWDQRVLLFSVDGTNGAALDLVLLDSAFPAMVLDDLRRGASFVCYAPPQGDHLGLPHHALGELVTLLGRLRPDVLSAFGNATIGACLDQLQRAAGIAPRVLVEHRAIEDPATDFRQHLISVLELWGGNEESAR
ncbi:MAG: response regulator [Planctomycetes bacterium]|jgi:DNA-binding response OmpR family regulator|nr:response regulator [Planctomycetota bacterium]